MEPIHRIYRLHSEVTKFRVEHELTEKNPLEIDEVAEAVDGLFAELVKEVPQNQRDTFKRLGVNVFFRIGRPGGENAVTDWITTVEKAISREKDRIKGMLAQEVHELEGPAKIGKAQQERARSIRKRYPNDEAYLEKVLEIHEKHPAWSYRLVRRDAGRQLQVHPDTVKRYVPRKPW